MSKSCNSSEVALVNFGPAATAQPRTLGELELVISHARCAFVYSGLALTKIRDEKLYLEAGHNTFEAYCRGRWQFSRQRAHQLISGAEIAVYLSTQVDITPPDNEVQVRPLVGRPLDEAAEIWKLANEMAAGAPVSGALVKKAIKALLGEAPKPGKSVTDLFEKVLRSCHELSEHLADSDLSGLDPKDKTRLLFAAREVMKLASKLNVPARPTATPVRTRKQLISEANSMCKSLANLS